ncbi:MAG: SRPBCC family protein [Pseudomonadota bacterium]
MTATFSDDLDLRITRTVKAPREMVWRAWADPRQLEKWWCPKPWRAEVQGFDLRPGGAFDTMMRGPNGEESGGRGVFLEVAERERIVFSSLLMAGWRPAPSPELPMTVIITMADEDDGTLYDAHVMHADSSARERHEGFGFFDGWNTGVDQLEAIAIALQSGKG